MKKKKNWSNFRKQQQQFPFIFYFFDSLHFFSFSEFNNTISKKKTQFFYYI